VLLLLRRASIYKRKLTESSCLEFLLVAWLWTKILAGKYQFKRRRRVVGGDFFFLSIFSRTLDWGYYAVMSVTVSLR